MGSIASVDLHHLARANASGAYTQLHLASVDHGMDVLKVWFLPLPSLDIGMTNFMGFLAAFSADVANVCHLFSTGSARSS